MQTQVWGSLIGVALGGILSYLAQLTTARQVSRAEDVRHAAQLGEARRAEQLSLVREFIGLAQEGIFLASARDSAPDWEAAGTPEWGAAARSLNERLWACERMIKVLFRQEIFERAWAYASAVDHVLWRLPDEAAAEGPLWDSLTGPETAFLEAVRAEFG
ncbi:hypothetical protein ACH47Z_15910 [Streptomyces sp. NPDC020192]|uniref:hypothetical protein n=1 Tax=Streptomyces sp. NPDC020192 TaxID=3365066 RepID=UPI0037AAC48A